MKILPITSISAYSSFNSKNKQKDTYKNKRNNHVTSNKKFTIDILI